MAIDVDPCTTCGLGIECKCEPPTVTATGFEGSCEGCGRLVQVDQRIRLWDDGVVTHVECPERASA